MKRLLRRPDLTGLLTELTTYYRDVLAVQLGTGARVQRQSGRSDPALLARRAALPALSQARRDPRRPYGPPRFRRRSPARDGSALHRLWPSRSEPRFARETGGSSSSTWRYGLPVARDMPKLAGAVSGDVRVVVARDHLRRLAGRGRGGESGCSMPRSPRTRSSPLSSGPRPRRRSRRRSPAGRRSTRSGRSSRWDARPRSRACVGTVRAGRTWCATYVVASTNVRPGYEVAACSSMTWKPSVQLAASTTTGNRPWPDASHNAGRVRSLTRS